MKNLAPERETIELLAPARNLQCGIRAVDCGADAVYIGGPSFGARAAAGNSVEDIVALCNYAHPFGVRVYVTINTILFDDELSVVEALIWQLYKVGVDALIVQDLALLRLDLPPIALHASTQMDTRTPEKAHLLETLGFSQIVVARELTLESIREIAQSVSVPIEAFVHGALCVSYSGRCYASLMCFDRSANRGACAQFCRLPFDLIDAHGEVLEHDKFLLSLRDMNRSADVEEMMLAGVRSFKIEGRLKDENYVANVTAYYRQVLDEAINKHADRFSRLSRGRSLLDFTADVDATFNRGYTDYFLHGRKASVSNFNTPKMQGKEVGCVQQIPNSRTVVVRCAQHDTVFSAGDGITYYDRETGRLEGFRVNRSERIGVDLWKIFAHRAVTLSQGQQLFRNYDAAFQEQLRKSRALRKLFVYIYIKECDEGFLLTMKDEDGHEVSIVKSAQHEKAQTSQRKNIEQQFSKLGTTIFSAAEVVVDTDCFIPSSQLSMWRRELADAFMQLLCDSYLRMERKVVNLDAASEQAHEIYGTSVDFTENVSNKLACDVMHDLGVERISEAAECDVPESSVRMMTCKHCLRYAFGQCPKHQHPVRRWNEPLRLRLSDGRTFPLSFDCARCEMSVWSENEPSSL